ncbi:MAG: hypothetical protein HXS52_00345 [Theionarchaea archaeon]|nr:hypothetical protein [Theionarchaea archaeon]MBU7036350.1 hypothetical protein [Theionarchaea archaeon]
MAPEYYLDKDFSPYFPYSEPAISPEGKAGIRHVRWKRDVGYYLGDPMLVDGFIFVANLRTMTCIHSKTRKTLWNYTAKGNIPLSYPFHQFVHTWIEILRLSQKMG